MKSILLGSILLLTACAHQTTAPSPEVAFDSMADGLITAEAKRRDTKQGVCFDITLKMKGVEKYDASSANWTAAWVDDQSKYFLLNLNQRDPASSPKSGSDGWMNQLITCAPQVTKDKIKTLILTPKTLPYKETEGMTLEWK